MRWPSCSLLGNGLSICSTPIPAVYWGRYGADADTPFFSLGSVDPGRQEPPAASPRSALAFRHQPAFLGWSQLSRTNIAPAAGYSWMTIPSFQDLAGARHWHFLFAWILAVNLLVYLAWSLRQRRTFPARHPARLRRPEKHSAIDPGPYPVQASGRQAAKRYQCAAEACLSGGDLPDLPDGGDGADHVARHQCLLSLAAGYSGRAHKRARLHFLSATLILLFIFVLSPRFSLRASSMKSVPP